MTLDMPLIRDDKSDVPVVLPFDTSSLYVASDSGVPESI